jgi:hypothetical protein
MRTTKEHALIRTANIAKETYLSTAGGRIRCLRCTAQSTRTGQQCRRPALTESKTQKCQFHGGRGSGPKTALGIAKIVASHTVHGQESRIAKAQRSAASAHISQLEDAVHLFGMATGPRSRGRKARSYVPIRTMAECIACSKGLLHPNFAVARAGFKL